MRIFLIALHYKKENKKHNANDVYNHSNFLQRIDIDDLIMIFNYSKLLKVYFLIMKPLFF